MFACESAQQAERMAVEGYYEHIVHWYHVL